MGTTIVGSIIGGAIGFWGFGVGAGPGASWGGYGGNLIGTAMCSSFFE